ncbi:MAG: sensor histidine kinase [Nitrospinota bacterium]
MQLKRSKQETFVRAIWIVIVAGMIATALIAINLNTKLINESERAFVGNLKLLAESSAKSLQLFFEGVISEIILLTEIDSIKNYQAESSNIAFRGIIAKHGNLIDYLALVNSLGQPTIAVTDIVDSGKINPKVKPFYDMTTDMWHINIDTKLFFEDPTQHISIGMPIFRKIDPNLESSEGIVSLIYSSGMVMALVNGKDLVRKFASVDKPANTTIFWLTSPDGTPFGATDKVKLIADTIYKDSEKSLQKLNDDISLAIDNRAPDSWTIVGNDHRLVHVKTDEKNYYLATAELVIAGERWLVTAAALEQEATYIINTYTIQSFSLFALVAILLITAGIELTKYSVEIARTEEQNKASIILAEKNRSLSELNQRLDEFVSIVSHDIKAPLGVIRGFAKLIEFDKKRSLPFKREVAAIITSSDRLLQLVSDILDVSKIESGKASILFEPVKIDTLLEESVEIISKIDLDKNILFTLNLNDASVILGDSPKLLRLFNNILGNAVKFSPSNGEITIDKINQDKSVLLKFSDLGPGVPLEDQEKVFDKFEQVKTSGHTERLGGGLGLTISKGIVELHNGSIYVQPNEKRGAVFVIELPYGQEFGNKS